MIRILISCFFLSLVFVTSVNAGDGLAVGLTCGKMTESNVESANCIHKVMKRYESDLAKLEEKHLKQAKKNDEEFQLLHKYEVRFYKTLKASNDAFHAYMEAECNRVRHNYLSASTAGHQYALCKIDMISERINRLKN